MTRPLSRRASRLLVIILVVVAFALALASTYYIIHTARSAQDAPAGEEGTPARLAPSSS